MSRRMQPPRAAAPQTPNPLPENSNASVPASSNAVPNTPGFALGTNLDVSSTVISTVAKNGRRRQARLEDLDTDELEHYSEDVVEMSNKRKITTRNAFDIKMIACTYELLQRSNVPPTPETSRGTTDEIKMFANRLETCGKIFGMRVDNTRLYATDLTDDLERLAKGKRLKAKEAGEGDAEVVEEEEEEAAEENPQEKRAPTEEVPEVVAVAPRRVKKNRKSHVVEDEEELACAETEINANFVSRFWSLIGNVQPGVMKDSWVHQGERIENTERLTFIMDPGLTCVQRYKHMLPHTAAVEAEAPRSQRAAPTLKKEVADSAERAVLQLSLQLKISQRLTVDSCVSFPRAHEKYIAKAEQSAGEKTKRNHRVLPENVADIDNLEARFLERCSISVDGTVHQMTEEEPAIEEDEEVQAREIVPSRFRTPQDLDVSNVTDDLHGDMIVDDDDTGISKNSSITPAVEDAGEEIPSIQDMDTVNNENVGSEHSSDPFRFVAPGASGRGLSENRSVHAPSEPGSASSKTSKKSRYGSVVQELPDVIVDEKPSLLNSSLLSMKSGSRAEKDETFPPSLTFTNEEFMRVSSILARSKRDTIRNGSKDKLCAQILRSPGRDVPPVIIPSRTFLQLPPGLGRCDPEAVMSVLGIQTKALQKNLKDLMTWLPPVDDNGDNTEINNDELVLACRRGYDEDFDADLERLQRGWGDNDDNYSLSSEDISDQEDFADADDGTLNTPSDQISTVASPDTDERSASHLDTTNPELSAVMDDLPVDEGNSDTTKDPVQPDTEATASLDGVPSRSPFHSPEQRVAEDAPAGSDWRDVIDLPVAARTDKDLGILSAQDVRQSGIDVVANFEQLTEEDYAPETNVVFAENIALRDCTGAGVNIGKMKLAVQKTYMMLIKYRQRAWERGRGQDREQMPVLRARHLIEWVYLKLDRKQRNHINPSVVFSCLLHLAYEKKLYLICAEDLTDVHVMTEEEYTSYTRLHPHLNRLTDPYITTLLRLPLPLSITPEVDIPTPDSSPAAPGHPATAALQSDVESDESDTETASLATTSPRTTATSVAKRMRVLETE